MASTEWQEIYDSYTDDELTEEIVRLKKEATLYTAQNEGEKGYSKDLASVRDRLHAAVRVRSLRRGATSNVMVPDFSNGIN